MSGWTLTRASIKLAALRLVGSFAQELERHTVGTCVRKLDLAHVTAQFVGSRDPEQGEKGA